MGERQRTLAGRTQTLHGVGLHTGKPSSVILGPAAAGCGLVFQRADRPAAPDIPARVEYVVQTERCTTLAAGGVQVRTVEHLLAACALAGLDNAVLSVEGDELPAADGSAQPFLELIEHVGLVEQEEERAVCTLRERVEVPGGGSQNWRMMAEPSDRLSLVFKFRGNGPLNGQEVSFTPGVDAPQAVSLARTFCFEEEIQALLKRGLGQGGNADNVLVLRSDGTSVNPPRVMQEPLRHKLLDLIGDFALAGVPIAARVVAEGTGHAAHVEFLRMLQPKLIKLEVPA